MEEEGIEGSEYSPKSEFSKAKMVYEAMQKCILSRGQEMKPGYVNIKFTKEGTPLKIWIPDSRLIYMGSVKALKLLLNPEITKTKGFIERIKTFEGKVKDLKDKNSYEELEKTKQGDHIRYIKTGRKFIPEIGSLVILQDVLSPRAGNEIKGGWDNKTNFYWDVVLQEYDLLLAILSDLIDKMNYFKAKTNY